MAWTQDQQRAIQARDENLLLSAAAGSGKTTVLVERVLSLIEEGASVDRMLIVTFSRAAAADMKAKLTARLTRRAQEDLSLAPQVEKVERASVCTLHAYCIDVLRNHFEAAGVDPTFRVLDDGENSLLKARALEQALEQALSQPTPQLQELLYGRDLKALSALVLELYEFSQARPDPQAWLDQFLEDPLQDGGQRWLDVLAQRSRQLTQEAAALARCACQLAGQGPQVYLRALEEDLNALEALSALAGYEALRQGLCGYAQTRLSPLRGEKDPWVLDLAQQIKELRKDQKDKIASAQDMLLPPSEALADQLALTPACQALNRLTSDFAQTLWRLKQDRSALTFGDLEHAALRALSDPRVAQAQQSRFDYLFVDEYQDVSDLQEAIIQKVARPGRLFMVGDVKQSIYRFRQAEPSLFIEKYVGYGQGQGGQLICLSQNFRSRPAILGLVNRVFQRVMSGPNAELQYDQAAWLNPGAAFLGQDPPVQVWLLEKGSAQGEAAELTQAQAEGALAARRIQEMLGSPFYDLREQRERPLRPGDVAVLARTRASLAACEEMLRAAGIPCYLDASEGYFDALEVRVALQLMGTVENQLRDFPLLAVLRSPIVGLTSTQLAQIRAGHPQGPFYQAVQAQMDQEGALADKLRAFFQQLSRWRALSRALPLAQWLDLVLMESGYYAYVGGMPGGASRQANLDLLCAYASQFEANQSDGLTGFLDYVAEMGGAGSDMGTAHTLGEGDDVVRLMTAHKSKGLEFPVVLALGLGRSLTGRSSGGELRCHRRLGVGLYCNDPELGTQRDTLCRRAVCCLQRQEALEEEKRILYVMLTRAQHQLILIGSPASAQASQVRWQMLEDAPLEPENFLDMIMPYLGYDAQVCWPQTEEQPRPAPPAPEGEPEPDGALVQDFAAAFAWRYPHEDQALAPLKLTASGLNREITGPAAIPPTARRPRFLSQQGMTAAERGTLIHNALSALDLAALGDCPDLDQALAAQLEELYARNLVSQPVDAAPLAAFFRRETGRRLLASPLVRREWPFNLRMNAQEALGVDSQARVVVQGVVDCCFMEDGAWVLLDYKTDRLEDEDLLRRYRAQVELYRKALERITGIPVKETLLCLLSAGRELRV